MWFGGAQTHTPANKLPLHNYIVQPVSSSIKVFFFLHFATIHGAHLTTHKIAYYFGFSTFFSAHFIHKWKRSINNCRVIFTIWQIVQLNIMVFYWLFLNRVVFALNVSLARQSTIIQCCYAMMLEHILFTYHYLLVWLFNNKHFFEQKQKSAVEKQNST